MTLSLHEVTYNATNCFNINIASFFIQQVNVIKTIDLNSAFFNFSFKLYSTVCLNYFCLGDDYVCKSFRKIKDKKLLLMFKNLRRYA